MNLRSRQGDKEKGRQGDSTERPPAPCLLVSLSPCLRCLLLCAMIALTGCPRAESPLPTPTTPRASVALRVLVVNEPGVAEAINRLRGEWAERSGGELSATQRQWKYVAAESSIDA